LGVFGEFVEIIAKGLQFEVKVQGVEQGGAGLTDVKAVFTGVLVANGCGCGRILSWARSAERSAFSGQLSAFEGQAPRKARDRHSHYSVIALRSNLPIIRSACERDEGCNCRYGYKGLGVQLKSCQNLQFFKVKAAGDEEDEETERSRIKSGRKSPNIGSHAANAANGQRCLDGLTG